MLRCFTKTRLKESFLNIRRLKHTTSEKQEFQTVDGCTAVTHVAYAMSDSAYIFPITPSSPIAELAEQWSSLGVKNAFGDIVKITQLQSEAGAAGSLHGALVTGSLATTFTASQGALLMIPAFYKISGELLPCAVHIAARAIASQGLCIFGDHQDIMALRSTGFAILGSTTVQECHDMALASHLATLRARVPFHHFFDGFRLSHTIEKIQMLPYGEIRKMVDYEALSAHHSRALNPIHPHVRGSNQNPDVYFQMLETSNNYYENTPQIVTEEFAKIKKLTGRSYKIFDFFGPEDADAALVVLGSGASVVQETLPYLASLGHKTGLVVPRLFRPWSAKDFLAALPTTIKRIAVLDRTKEPGSLGEPLYLDVAASIQYSGRPMKVIGGRYGLGQKEFTPACVVSVVENLYKDAPLERFTIGIEDDVSFLSLPSLDEPAVIPASATECLIYGFGSDGTVGANKNAIKIIGDNTDKFVQGYFAYGSQKAGGLTVSHLRFGSEPFKSYYSVMKADYVGCHNPVYVDMYRMLDQAAPGSTFCLNSPWGTLEELETHLPSSLKRALAVKNINFYNIDAFKVADENGMGRMINVVMQTAFFKLSNVIGYEDAIAYFKKAIQKSYSHRGEDVVKKNFKMVDDSLQNLHKVVVPAHWATYDDSSLSTELKYSSSESDFIKLIQGPITMLKGDQIPVSVLAQSALGGVMPMGTAALEKRGVALEVPEVDMSKCTQCNYCSLSCPHAVIRPFLLSQDEFDTRPSTFDARKAKGGSEVSGLYFRIQVSPYDCTGCSVCVNTCPDDALRMVKLSDIHETSSENWDFSMKLPDRGDRFEKTSSLKGSQFQQPLLEFSGACSGCGETPYVKLVTQLFGNRMIIANATGCSSIWGAPFGSNPYTTRKADGKGPAWGNSLFEDAAEYGLGMAVTTSIRRRALRTRVQGLLQEGGDAPLEPELYAQLQEWVENSNDWKVCDRLSTSLPQLLAQSAAVSPVMSEISKMSDLLPKLSVWVIGGDGWAYDIGFGGLDHALASGQDMNVLVLDTEVYSNTGGQTSKATPLGAIAKFATGGREQNKKSLAEMALSYGTVYVANVSMGASMQQTMKAFIEAERYNGPSLVIAYSPCIEHKNIDGMSHTMQHMAIAANSGYFPLFRFNPDLAKHGKNPFTLDTKRITVDVAKVIEGEMRYGALKRRDLQKFNNSVAGLRSWIDERFSNLKRLSEQTDDKVKNEGVPLTILYGSETGNTQELAFRTAEQASKRGFSVKVMECDEVTDLSEFAENGGNLVVMCATCGEGDAPKNAGQFVSLLQESKVSLVGVNFSVFAMGDSSYHQFCSVGKSIDQELGRLGATRFSPLGIGNDRDEDKFETGFSTWAPGVWKALNSPEVVEDGASDALLEVVALDASAAALAPYKRLAPENTVACLVEFNQRLTADDYDRDIRHLRMKATSDLPYLLGDVLNVSVVNDAARVKSFLEACNYSSEQVVKFTQLSDNLDSRKKSLCLRPRSISQVFEEVLDIFGRPSKTFYSNLANFANSEIEKDKLKLIASDSDEGKLLYNEMSTDGVTFADVLMQFPSARPPLGHLVSMIPCTRPRLYSIASSPRFVGQEYIELAVVILEWKGKKGSLRKGTGTDYIRRVKSGDRLHCTVSTGTFNFPTSPETPMIMAGLGTGLAPFRAFIQERAWMKNMGTNSLGNLWLFYGCRFKAKDYIFGDELEQYHRDGILTELHPAFSRDQSKKIYVQNKIDENAERIFTDLIEKQGFFYLCGQAGQTEKDIRSAVYRSISGGLKISQEEAEKKFEDLAEEGRYCPELY